MEAILNNYLHTSQTLLSKHRLRGIHMHNACGYIPDQRLSLDTLYPLGLCNNVSRYIVTDWTLTHQSTTFGGQQKKGGRRGKQLHREQRPAEYSNV